MAKFTVTLHPRDKNGKFRRAVNANRKRRINRLTRKNKRVVRQYASDKSLHGTPMGDAIERNIIGRAVKVQRLQAKLVKR